MPKKIKTSKILMCNLLPHESFTKKWEVLNFDEEHLVTNWVMFPIGNLPGYKAFNSVHTEKNCGELFVFCRKDFSFKALEVSNSNVEVIEHVYVKLLSANKKKWTLLVFMGHLHMGFKHVSSLKLKKQPTLLQ